MLFEKFRDNPILTPDYKIPFESKSVYNPCAIVHQKKIYLIYRAEGQDNISRLCLAISRNGFTFKKYEKNPIIVPSLPEERKAVKNRITGCEDPRITKINKTYYLTYTAYGGKKVTIGLSSSKDLVHWRKEGIIVRENYKSGALYNLKIDDKYVMLIMEREKKGRVRTYMASSYDLKKWQINKKPFMEPRKNKFDNWLIEPGPAPFLIKNKLVLIHNTANKSRVYQPSLAVFSNDLSKLIFRSDKPILIPSEQFELFGKVNNVIFCNGLIKFNKKYFLYYGGADKCIGVATCKETELEKFISDLS